MVVFLSLIQSGSVFSANSLPWLGIYISFESMNSDPTPTNGICLNSDSFCEHGPEWMEVFHVASFSIQRGSPSFCFTDRLSLSDS